jgi:hypothetical protein
LASEYRHRQAALQSALAAPAPPFVAYRARLAESSLNPAQRERVLPALLHLAAIRLVGIDPVEEARGFYFWERTLDGLIKRQYND